MSHVELAEPGGTARYLLRIALPPAATLAAYPRIVSTLGGDGPLGVARSSALLALWLGLWAAAGAPRPGEPDVHDRQVDVILALPLLAGALWLSLSFERTPWLTPGLSDDGLVAMALFLGGASALLLGTRLTSRLTPLVLLPLVDLPALSGHPLVAATAVSAVASLLLASWSKRARGRQPGSASSRSAAAQSAATARWSRAVSQPLPRLLPTLVLVAGATLVLATGAGVST